jgi:prepilin-type N-terminal cleavage/methylation domain-containing protein
MKLNNKLGFTFIEVLISTFISAIVLGVIFKFLFMVYDEIENNKNTIKYINSTYILKNKIIDISTKFNSGELLFNTD